MPKYFSEAKVESLLEDKPQSDSGYFWHIHHRASTQMKYDQSLGLLSALEVLSATEIFVGSLHSNTDNLVMTLRAAKGKSPLSTISVDGSKYRPAPTI